MITEAASVGLLLKALGYGVPAAFLVLSFLLVGILTRYLQAKSEKDREEHMVKWQSMIDVQEKSVKNQERTTTALLQNHKDEVTRMFILQERQAQTLESLAHNLSTITNQIEHRYLCPNTQEKS